MEKKSPKLYHTNYNLLITPDLWQDSIINRILSIVLLKEFIKLNVKVKMIIKFVKRVELKTKILFAFLNAQTLNFKPKFSKKT